MDVFVSVNGKLRLITTPTVETVSLEKKWVIVEQIKISTFNWKRVPYQTPINSTSTDWQKVCLKPAHNWRPALSCRLYSLNAKGTCCGLSLGRRPTYFVNITKTSAIGEDNICTLWSIPANALAVYAPRENPKHTHINKFSYSTQNVRKFPLAKNTDLITKSIILHEELRIRQNMRRCFAWGVLDYGPDILRWHAWEDTFQVELITLKGNVCL